LVSEGRVSFPAEAPREPDVALESAPEVLNELLAGYTTFDSANAAGRIHIEGSKTEARRFFDMFRLLSHVAAANRRPARST
jgi:putative sterol carrier protein